jgi:hypothetical protein
LVPFHPITADAVLAPSGVRYTPRVRQAARSLVALAGIAALPMRDAGATSLRLLCTVKVAGAPGQASPDSEAVKASLRKVAAFAAGLSAIDAASRRSEDEQALAQCGADAACIGARLEAQEVDLGLFLVVNLATLPPLLTGRIIDSHGTVLKSVARDLAAGRELSQDLVLAATELFEGSGHPIGGRLWVQPTPPDAQVSLEGNPELESALPGSFLVPPGTYVVRAFRDGYAASSTQATVAQMVDTRATLTLAPARTIFASPWFWVIGAVAVAGGAAGLALALHHEGPTTFCQTDLPSCR